MEVVTQGKYLTTSHIWFEPTLEDFLPRNKVDLCVLHGRSHPVARRGYVNSRQDTLFTDLTLPKEQLYKFITGKTQKQILRAQLEKTAVRTYDSQAILENPGMLTAFADTYARMFRDKGLAKTLQLQSLLAYAMQDALFITIAGDAQRDYVYHSYVVDGRHARAQYSCSLFREAGQELRSYIGRANKYLHWCDLQLFKNQGYAVYDWGGISSWTAPNGIDRFKVAFGGHAGAYYNVSFPVSGRAKLCQKVRNSVARLQNRHL